MRSTWLDGLADVVSCGGESGPAGLGGPDESAPDAQAVRSGDPLGLQQAGSAAAGLRMAANERLGRQKGEVGGEAKNGEAEKKHLPKMAWAASMRD